MAPKETLTKSPRVWNLFALTTHFGNGGGRGGGGKKLNVNILVAIAVVFVL